MQSKKNSRRGRPKGSKNKATRQGLGDIVDEITTKTGVKKLVKDIFGNNCGCEDRKKWLNKYTPWAVNRKMTEGQLSVYNRLKHFRKEQTIPADANRAITELFNEVYQPEVKAEPVTCSSCIGELYSRLESLSFVAENTQCESSQK